MDKLVYRPRLLFLVNSLLRFGAVSFSLMNWRTKAMINGQKELEVPADWVRKEEKLCLAT